MAEGTDAPVKSTKGERINKALELAYWGQIDGAHHKTWVIDQMVRALVGSDKAYKKWVKEFEAGKEGPHTYEWDEGMAP